MEKEELIQLFEDFLNEFGQWWNFVEWLKEREDKVPTDLGFKSNE